MDQFELFVVAPHSERQSSDALILRYGSDLTDRDSTTVVAIDSGRRASTGGEIQTIVENIFDTERIDLVVSSHADEDHAGGIPHLLNNLEVGEVWIHRPQDHRTSSDEPLAATASITHVRDILTTAEHRGVPITEPFSDLVDHGFDRLHILGPSIEFYEELMERGMYSDDELDAAAVASLRASAAHESTLLTDPTTSHRNNSSTILLLSLDTQQLLLTGDAGVKAFESAKPRFSECEYTAEKAIIQIPHHGSRNSLNPESADLLLGTTAGDRRAFVTAAVDDRYGFPHVEVTDEFIRRGRRIPRPRKGVNLRYHHNCPFSTPDGYSPLDETNYIVGSWEQSAEGEAA